MTEDRAERIFEAAVQRYGARHQEDVMLEEMSELTKAIIKHRRYPDDPDTVDSILEEMADVDIMLRQMEVIFGAPVRWRQKKLRKLEALVDG